MLRIRRGRRRRLRRRRATGVLLRDSRLQAPPRCLQDAKPQRSADARRLQAPFFSAAQRLPASRTQAPGCSNSKRRGPASGWSDSVSMPLDNRTPWALGQCPVSAVGKGCPAPSSRHGFPPHTDEVHRYPRPRRPARRDRLRSGAGAHVGRADAAGTHPAPRADPDRVQQHHRGPARFSAGRRALAAAAGPGRHAEPAARGEQGGLPAPAAAPGLALAVSVRAGCGRLRGNRAGAEPVVLPGRGAAPRGDALRLVHASVADVLRLRRPGRVVARRAGGLRAGRASNNSPGAPGAGRSAAGSASGSEHSGEQSRGPPVR